MPVSDPSDLYGLPLERFVPERAALAKALRAAGRRDEAVAAAALRKPSVAAWAVNQLVRTQHVALAALFEAGDELQRAQTDLLSGQADAAALREAGRREREAADALAAVARGLLSAGGNEPTQATLDRVADTFHAAALDEQARARVRAGCLVRELQQVGFGGVAEAAAPPARVANAAARADEAARAEDAAHAKAAARAEAAARTEALRSARVAEAEARRRAELAARQLQTAQERRDRAAEALAGAEEALVGAAEHAAETAREHARAQAELEALRGR